MINAQDHVVLVDFGIAKPFQVGQRGTMIGTEGYSPPEQYRGEASPLADIYALGATLHHALSHHDPRLEAPFSFNERPLRQINPNVSPVLEKVINKALQYNPEERFQTAEEFKEALLGVAQETGLLSQIPASMSTTSKTKEDVKPVWAFKCEDDPVDDVFEASAPGPSGVRRGVDVGLWFRWVEISPDKSASVCSVLASVAASGWKPRHWDVGDPPRARKQARRGHGPSLLERGMDSQLPFPLEHRLPHAGVDR